MTVPDRASYKDIHQDSPIPKLSLTDINKFLTINNASLIEKAKTFHKDQFIIYARYSNTTSTFIHAKCHAEMKKSVCYYIDIKLDRDGIVIETQCDCGAGQGPDAHCKHVQTVLWGLYKWATTGEMRTEETCTQKLQTFHKTKRFKGSPIKCADLNLGTEGNFDYDPRPEKYRNNKGYPDFVKNMVINFQSDHPLPIATTIAPANSYSLIADHSYLTADPEQKFLSENNLSQISNQIINHIEEHTRSQSKSQLWKDARSIRLTASNFKRICSATDQTNFKQLAANLTQHKDINSKYIKHGKKFEEMAVKALEKEMSVATEECGLFVSKEHPYLAASPDRVFGDDTVVEVKCPWTCQSKPITPLTVPYLQNIEGKLSLDPRHQYYYQVQGQLLCTGRTCALFGVYASETKEIKIVRIVRDEEFIASMVSRLQKFYNSHFKFAVLKRFVHHNYYDYTFRPDSIANESR